MENCDVEKFLIVIDGCDTLLYCKSRGLGDSLVSINIVAKEVVTSKEAFNEKIRGTTLARERCIVLLFCCYCFVVLIPLF